MSNESLSETRKLLEEVRAIRDQLLDLSKSLRKEGGDDLLDELAGLQDEVNRLRAKATARSRPGVLLVEMDEFDVRTKVKGVRASLDLRMPLLKLVGNVASSLIANFIWSKFSGKEEQEAETEPQSQQEPKPSPAETDNSSAKV